MGSDKALLPFGQSETLTQYQIKRVSGWFQSVHVSCKRRDKFDFEASFIEDFEDFDVFSPLVALYSILTRLKTEIAILSVDTPFVDREVYEKLYENLQNHDAVIAKSPFGSHQMCGIYRPSILPILKEHILDNNHKIRELLKRVETNYVEFSDDRPFTNLNKIEEYKKALQG